MKAVTSNSFFGIGVLVFVENVRGSSTGTFLPDADQISGEKKNWLLFRIRSKVVIMNRHHLEIGQKQLFSITVVITYLKFLVFLL
jgi:hypothetical protein